MVVEKVKQKIKAKLLPSFISISTYLFEGDIFSMILRYFYPPYEAGEDGIKSSLEKKKP